MHNTLLGGLTPAQFMRRHWQKSARLIRQAMPGFTGVVSPGELFALAARDDVESRLVLRSVRRHSSTREPGWSLEHGPFRRADLRQLPPANWTLLVQGVDLHVDAASELLRQFSFIPHARLDDLMISYAAPGGGVGPHVDSYDVFLLQGAGRRRWRTSTQKDLRLRPGLPLKILQRFDAESDWILDPGDMLYLPPSVAHDGEAVTACTTYSIGFRAPTAQELVEGFLQFLPDALSIAAARYGDPDLAPTKHAGRIDAAMQRRLGTMLKAVRWNSATIASFIGCVLSEPKPDVFLEPPATPLSRSRFVGRVTNRRRGGVRLDRRSRMLYDSTDVYLNGAPIARIAEHPTLAMLADNRRLNADTRWSESTLHILYAAYLTGALHAGAEG